MASGSNLLHSMLVVRRRARFGRARRKRGCDESMTYKTGWLCKFRSFYKLKRDSIYLSESINLKGCKLKRRYELSEGDSVGAGVGN